MLIIVYMLFSFMGADAFNLNKSFQMSFTDESEKRSIQILAQLGVILEQVCWIMFKAKGNNSVGIVHYHQCKYILQMNFLHNRLIITLQKLGHVLLNFQKVNFPLHVRVIDVVYFYYEVTFRRSWLLNVVIVQEKNQPN